MPKHKYDQEAEQPPRDELFSTHGVRPITDAYHADISVLMNPGTQKRQSMKGFDDDYVDIADYIVRCTHKIWEEKGLGLIYTPYRHNAVTHTTEGLTYGRDKVVADSAKTLSSVSRRSAFRRRSDLVR